MFEDICFKQGTQFRSAHSSSGLIYYGPANGHLEDRYHARFTLLLLFTMKFFYIFFRINFSKKFNFFCVLAQENQDELSERCSLISVILQGLVKSCEKYMEVNHFLL